jgi:hypothetical protein
MRRGLRVRRIEKQHHHNTIHGRCGGDVGPAVRASRLPVVFSR